MENELSGSELLKIDRRGRVVVPAERREMLLDEFERCGVSGAAFAKRIGVKYTTFAAWRQRRVRQRARVTEGLAQEQGGSGAATMMPSLQWMEAVVEGDGDGSGHCSIWIELAGGRRVEMREAGQAKLVAALLWALADGKPEGGAHSITHTKEALAC